MPQSHLMSKGQFYKIRLSGVEYLILLECDPKRRSDIKTFIYFKGNLLEEGQTFAIPCYSTAYSILRLYIRNKDK